MMQGYLMTYALGLANLATGAIAAAILVVFVDDGAAHQQQQQQAETVEQRMASEQANAQAQALLNDARLTGLCVLGAVAGAFLAISIWPPKNYTQANQLRSLGAKFGASMISGATFTPAIIRAADWPIDADVVLAVSTGVAMVAVAVIHAVVPILENACARFLARKIEQYVPPRSPPLEPPSEVEERAED